MNKACFWTMLVGMLVCVAPVALAQQRTTPPLLPSTGAAIAVAPAQDGQPAVWVTNGAFVFYCVRRPPEKPGDPAENPVAGKLYCAGAAISGPGPK
jgi:hypothetical protein